VIAMDVNVEAPFGLAGAAAYLEAGYTILPVQGDLEQPPLQAGRTSLLLFNVSLHNSCNLRGTLRRGAEALRPGGRMIIRRHTDLAPGGARQWSGGPASGPRRAGPSVLRHRSAVELAPGWTGPSLVDPPGQEPTAGAAVVLVPDRSGGQGSDS
jgi:hypothetical protein